MPIVIYGGGSIMLGGCFAAGGIVASQKTDGIISKDHYLEQKENLKNSVKIISISLD